MFLFRRRPKHTGELDLCHVCCQDRVYPLSWHDTGGGRWWVELRCGECGGYRTGVFGEEALQRFERRLEVSRREIEREADRMHQGWRSAEADVFAAALDRDLIEAHDFAD
jgi:hypothetical protein